MEEEDSVKIHSYSVSPGLRESRDAVAEYLNKTYGTRVKGEFIFLTCGAAAALATVIKGLVNKGEEVLTFAPHFPEYRTYTEGVGAKLVNVNPGLHFLPAFKELFEYYRNK